MGQIHHELLQYKTARQCFKNLKEILKKKEDTINELSSKVINLNNLLQRYVEMESRKTLIDPINFDYKLKHIKELNNDKIKR